MKIKSLLILETTSLKNCIKKLNLIGSKTLIVIEKNERIKGVISDGDIRKSLLKGHSLNASIKQIYNKKPIYFFKNNYEEKKIKNIFSKNKIDLIPIINQNFKVIKIYRWDYFYKELKNKNFSIPVIIMAGGKGTRMKPFTEILPKPLLPISGKTVIEKIIENFNKFNFQNINIVINYKTNILKAFLLNIKSKVKIIEEKKYLGTVGGVKLLKIKKHKDLIISNCDTICDIDLENLFNFHKKNDYFLTAVVSNKKFNIPYGSCLTDDSGQLTKIEEKPKIDIFSLTGVYVIKTKCLNLIPKNKYFDINTLINNLINSKKKVGVYPIDEKKWVDVGEWKFYLESLNKKI